MRSTSVALVRSRIARAVLGSPLEVPATLGTIRLRDRQRSLASRVMRLIELHRGALLADPVGLGKTYAALAVARGFQRVIVVAPASLRDMWTAACASAGTRCCLVTHEALSRGMPAMPRIDRRALIVVDEAHRFRNPGTQRYARLTLLSRDACLLLISATPLQNRLQDLAAPLALFVGAEAFSLSAVALARYIVREKIDPASHDLPRLVGPERVPVAVDPSILESIIRLPAPLPASDEGVAAALIAQLLVRRWTSSQAALGESLRRLLAKTLALRDAALAGRRITRQDLCLWELTDDAVQLPFQTLLGVPAPLAEACESVATLETHAEALRSLLRRLARSDADAARARALCEVRCRHPAERIIAFSQYARTVDALFTRLSPSGGVAALTASGARIASGRITRAESIEQFTPHGGRRSHGAAEIDLLLATDLLSEGLNLQGASVVVHLDLPWNPARLDQRIGRVRRLGSRHARVAVYFVDPIGVSDAAREVEERLRAKLLIARDAIGAAEGVLPTDSAHDDRAMPAAAETLGATQRSLEEWQRVHPCSGDPATETNDILVASVQACARGWLCAYGTEPGSRLVAEIDCRVTDEPRHIDAALVHASGVQIEADGSRVAASLDAARRWIAARRAGRAVDLRAALTSRARRDLQSRIAQVLARSPRHRRSAVARVAACARLAVTMPLGLGAEQALHQLATADLPDEVWLSAVADFASSNGRDTLPAQADPHADERIVAMILFGMP